MTDQSEPHDPAEELISRLRVIEAQPLGERAAAYAALHDELGRRIEAGPVEPSE